MLNDDEKIEVIGLLKMYIPNFNNILADRTEIFLDELGKIRDKFIQDRNTDSNN